MYCVDHVVFQQSYQALEKFNRIKVQQDLSYFKNKIDISVVTLSGNENEDEFCVIEVIKKSDKQNDYKRKYSNESSAIPEKKLSLDKVRYR